MIEMNEEAQRGWSFHSRVEGQWSVNGKQTMVCKWKQEKSNLSVTLEHVKEYVATTREGYRAGSILRILGQGGEENILPNS